jgi:hypothetical protein
VKRLVWYEEFPWMIDAIAREKAIKNWPRRWKLELIEKGNPNGATSAIISCYGDMSYGRPMRKRPPPGAARALLHHCRHAGPRASEPHRVIRHPVQDSRSAIFCASVAA